MENLSAGKRISRRAFLSRLLPERETTQPSPTTLPSCVSSPVISRREFTKGGALVLFPLLLDIKLPFPLWPSERTPVDLPEDLQKIAAIIREPDAYGKTVPDYLKRASEQAKALGYIGYPDTFFAEAAQNAYSIDRLVQLYAKAGEKSAVLEQVQKTYNQNIPDQRLFWLREPTLRSNPVIAGENIPEGTSELVIRLQQAVWKETNGWSPARIILTLETEQNKPTEEENVFPPPHPAYAGWYEYQHSPDSYKPTVGNLTLFLPAQELDRRRLANSFIHELLGHGLDPLVTGVSQPMQHLAVASAWYDASPHALEYLDRTFDRGLGWKYPDLSFYRDYQNAQRLLDAPSLSQLTKEENHLSISGMRPAIEELKNMPPNSSTSIGRYLQHFEDRLADRLPSDVVDTARLLYVHKRLSQSPQDATPLPSQFIGELNKFIEYFVRHERELFAETIRHVLVNDPPNDPDLRQNFWKMEDFVEKLLKIIDAPSFSTVRNGVRLAIKEYQQKSLSP